jgi:hypothetical protein
LRILADERYIGTYIIGKRAVTEIGGHKMRLKDESEWHRIPEHHQAIVDAEVFEQVQATMRRSSQPNRKTHVYPLRGKVVCGLCWHALKRANNNVYFCRHAQTIASSPCHHQRIQAKELERMVFEIVSKQLEALQGIDAGEAESKLKTQLTQRAGFEDQIANIIDDKRLLFDQLMRGEIDDDTFKSRNTEYSAALQHVKNAYALVSAQARATEKLHDEKVKRQTIAREVSGKKELTQALADALIEKVVVYPGNRIEIAYRFKDDFRA